MFRGLIIIFSFFLAFSCNTVPLRTLAAPDFSTTICTEMSVSEMSAKKEIHIYIFNQPELDSIQLSINNKKASIFDMKEDGFTQITVKKRNLKQISIKHSYGQLHLLPDLRYHHLSVLYDLSAEKGVDCEWYLKYSATAPMGSLLSE